MTKRALVYAAHTRRWEIAHIEKDVASPAFWVRDDYSTICRVGDEIATAPLPTVPARAELAQ